MRRIGSRIIFALMLLSGLAPILDGSAQPHRQKLQRVGDIAFGVSFEDARGTADAQIGVAFATGDRRRLKTLAQTKVALFDAAFNLTYVFGDGDRLTRVFGSVVRAMDFGRDACLANGANLFAASVRQYGSPDLDRSGQFEREWRFNFADGRWIRLRYYFGGILNACNIIVESSTPEGQKDHS